MDCLNSLAEQTQASMLTIIVDNGSQDGTPSLIRERFPRVRLICNATNLGFAEACNIGIRVAMQAGAEFIFLLNNDTVVSCDLLQRMLRYANRHPEAAIFGARLDCASPPPSVVFSRKNIQLYWSVRKNRQSQCQVQMTSGPVDLVWGCGMLIRTSLLRQIGLFDPTFFAYDEDRDLCLRTRRAGHEIHLVGDAVIQHKVSASTGGLYRDSSFRAYLLGRNRVRLWKRNLTWGSAPQFAVSFFVRILIIVLSRWLRRNPQAATAALYGMYEGVVSGPQAWPRFPSRYCDVPGLDSAQIHDYALRSSR